MEPISYQKESNQAKMSQIILNCWRDPAYRVRLEREPRVALEEVGITIPDDIECSFVFDTAEKAYFVIPAPPTAKGLTDQEFAEFLGIQVHTGPGPGGTGS
jgi:hypothetical protein